MRNALILGLLFVTLQAGATVYYVRPTNGDNGNAGTSFAAAWQTTQYAIDNTTDGDEIRLCAEATETPTATIDIDQTYDSLVSPIYITGASGTDGSVDGTIYTISGSALGAGDDLIEIGAAADYARIKNIRFTAATRYNLYYSNVVEQWEIRNCRFDNADSHGLYSISAGPSAQIRLVDCEVDNNGGSGCSVNTLVARGFGQWINCSVHDNAGGGLADGKYHLSVIGCLIFDNAGGPGLDLSAFAYSATIIGNTIAFNSGDAIRLNNSTYQNPIIIRNNVFRSNGGYGLNLNGVALATLNEDYNCFSNNTSGTIDSGSIGPHSITSDPKFTSETDGAEDFMPQADSPLLEAGIDGGQW